MSQLPNSVYYSSILNWLFIGYHIKWVEFPLHFNGASLVVQMVKHLSAMLETWVWSLGPENPLEKAMATHSSTLPGKSHEQRSLVGYSPWDRKESDTTERLYFLLTYCLKSGLLSVNRLWSPQGMVFYVPFT